MRAAARRASESVAERKAESLRTGLVTTKIERAEPDLADDEFFGICDQQASAQISTRTAEKLTRMESGLVDRDAIVL